jgi:predicted DNA-binding transcriptional regulator AlpA
MDLTSAEVGAVNHERTRQEALLLNEKTVAERLGVTVHAMRRWRFEGRGPRFIHVGRLVRYRPEDVEAWLDAQPTGGEVAA